MTDPRGAVPQNLQQWWDVIRYTPQEPRPLTRASYEKLDPDDRDAYDTDRLTWLDISHVIETPALEKIRKDTRRIVRMQTAAIAAPRNTRYVIVSGEAGAGKTITSTRIGAEHERLVRARRRCASCPDCRPSDDGACSCERCADRADEFDKTIAPVVYIEVPGGSTPKQLMRTICHFTGQQAPSSADADTLTKIARNTLTELGTSLVILDEIQNVAPKSTTGEATADALKRFSGSMPAAFMYVGVNLTGEDDIPGQSGLFTGDAGQMIAARAKFTRLEPFGYSTTAQKVLWAGMVQAFEATLPLLDHKPGTLARKHADLLWDLTGGSLNTLWGLLSDVASDAIEDGTERIARQQLIPDMLDHHAQERLRRRNAQRDKSARR